MSYYTSPSGIILPNSVSIKKKPDSDFRNLRVTARNGRINLYKPVADGSDEEFTSIDIETARFRLKMFIEKLKYMKSQALTEVVVKEQIPALEDFMNRFNSAIKQAEEQGPIEYADMRRARVRDSAKTVFIGDPDAS